MKSVPLETLSGPVIYTNLLGILVALLVQVLDTVDGGVVELFLQLVSHL